MSNIKSFFYKYVKKYKNVDLKLWYKLISLNTIDDMLCFQTTEVNL